MKRSDKKNVIDSLTQEINSYSHFYLTDIEALNAEKTSALRAMCFQREIKLIVVKNALLHKALEASDKNAEELYSVLKGNTSLMFCNSASAPARLIKDFRKAEKIEKPLLKGAYAEECIYIGENQLDALVNIKSKEELIGELIGLLQSPAQKLISALQSGGNTITGVLKTLSEKE